MRVDILIKHKWLMLKFLFQYFVQADLTTLLCTFPE